MVLAELYRQYNLSSMIHVKNLVQGQYNPDQFAINNWWLNRGLGIVSDWLYNTYSSNVPMVHLTEQRKLTCQHVTSSELSNQQHWKLLIKVASLKLFWLPTAEWFQLLQKIFAIEGSIEVWI